MPGSGAGGGAAQRSPAPRLGPGPEPHTPPSPPWPAWPRRPSACGSGRSCRTATSASRYRTPWDAPRAVTSATGLVAAVASGLPRGTAGAIVKLRRGGDPSQRRGYCHPNGDRGDPAPGPDAQTSPCAPGKGGSGLCRARPGGFDWSRGPVGVIAQPGVAVGTGELRGFEGGAARSGAMLFHAPYRSSKPSFSKPEARLPGEWDSRGSGHATAGHLVPMPPPRAPSLRCRGLCAGKVTGVGDISTCFV